MRRYLSRSGVEMSVPAVSALTELHRAHAELVPYETFGCTSAKDGASPWTSHRNLVVLPDGTEVTAVSFDATDPYTREQSPAFGLYLDGSVLLEHSEPTRLILPWARTFPALG